MNIPTPPRNYDEWCTDEFKRRDDAAYLFGYYLVSHCRDEAIASISENASPDVKAAVNKAIDIALHNVCDLLEGFWPIEAGSDKRVSLALGVQVRNEANDVIETIEISPA